jgi:UDP-2,3-diacylglucosamine pyrophosphatase LpxH
VSSYPKVFDVAYSISDIHLGGSGDFQIFNNGKRLAKFIDHIAGLDPGERMVLVLNGDVIDSLAEENIGYIAITETEASDMIDRIIVDPAFVPVWDALARYTQTKNRYVVFVAGNHDIELGLPVVEARIREKLSGGDLAANARIEFSGRGAGYSCQVGGARAFFTHGNELDIANRVDNEKLGQLALAQNAGRIVPMSDWTPNFGTRLVVDVMNAIKKEHPFVDLLKPQSGAVFAILLILGKDALGAVSLKDLFNGLKSFKRSQDAGGDLLSMDVLAAEEGGFTDDPDIVELLGPRLTSFAQATSAAASEDDMLAAVEGRVLSGGVNSAPPVMASGEDDIETLGGVTKGLFGAIFNSEKHKKEGLREALLDWREAESKFGDEKETLEEEDRVAKWLQKPDTKSSAHFTVAGHTHKARSIEIQSGRSFYLNSGTWIRILNVTEAALEKGKNFDALWTALNGRSMAAMDKAKITVNGEDQALMMDFATAVHLKVSGDTVEGEIVKVSSTGRPTSVAHTKRTVSF